jgi:hypothetical protein
MDNNSSSSNKILNKMIIIKIRIKIRILKVKFNNKINFKTRVILIGHNKNNSRIKKVNIFNNNNFLIIINRFYTKIITMVEKIKISIIIIFNNNKILINGNRLNKKIL